VANSWATCSGKNGPKGVTKLQRGLERTIFEFPPKMWFRRNSR
jgi:hypothetical protein